MGEAKRRRRSEAIYATTAQNVRQLTVTFDHATGEVMFGDDVVDAYSEITYDRPKGPKVLSRVPQAADKISFSGEIALRRDFDFVVAVDTNTRAINGKRVSVTGIVVAKHSMIPGPAGILTDYWSLDVPLCIEFIELNEKPENFGWLAALEQLQNRSIITAAMKVGMIVDSDLGNIPAYNSRKSEVLPGSMLPEGVQLIYASSDVGKENVINKILAVADSVSAQVLNSVLSGRTPFNTSVIESPYFESMRIVTPKVAYR